MAELKAIHDFSAAPSVGASTLLLVDSVDAQASSGYRTDSMSAGALGAAVAGTFAYNSLNTTDKTLIGAINELEAGGGGGAGGMVVTVTNTGTVYAPVYVADKTFAEVSAAILAGANVSLFIGEDYYKPWSIDTTSGYITFVYFMQESTSTGKSFGFVGLVFYDDERIETDSGLDSIEVYQDYTGTLTAGQTSLTISGAGISSSKTMDFYTDIYGVSPTAVSVSSGSVTLTFEAQSANMSVKVRVW